MIERFFPNQYEKMVSDIDIENLKSKGIKGILIDIDNTLIDYYENISVSTHKWIEDVKENDIKVYLLSNNNKSRVQKIGKRLNVGGIHHAAKPRRWGILKALRLLGLKNSEVAVIGDQIFTDVYGGNRLNIYTILVQQINAKDIWITKWKRPVERHIIEEFKKGKKELIIKRDEWKLKSAKAKRVENN